MKRGLAKSQRRLQHGLGQGRVRMGCPRQVVSGSARLHGQSPFRNQVRDVRPQQMHPEDPAAASIANQPNQAIGLPEDPGARVRRERKLSHFHFRA